MSDASAVDGLIAALGSELQPVKPLRPPLWRAALWIGALVLAGSVMAAFADLRGIALRLSGAPDMWLAVLGSTLTAIFGAVAVFQLSLPDRTARWALLPLPSLVLWIGASGLGCMRTWVVPEMHAASMGETGTCFTFIVAVSIPLSVLTAIMVRRAYPLRPGLTATVAGLTVAAGAATLLNFFHPYDASAEDLAMHLAAVALVVACNQVWAARIRTARRPGPRSRDHSSL